MNVFYYYEYYLYHQRGKCFRMYFFSRYKPNCNRYGKCHTNGEPCLCKQCNYLYRQQQCYNYDKTVYDTRKYRFARLPRGNYLLTVSAPAFSTQTHMVTVTRNITVHTDFILEAEEHENNFETTSLLLRK